MRRDGRSREDLEGAGKKRIARLVVGCEIDSGSRSTTLHDRLYNHKPVACGHGAGQHNITNFFTRV